MLIAEWSNFADWIMLVADWSHLARDAKRQCQPSSKKPNTLPTKKRVALLIEVFCSLGCNATAVRYTPCIIYRESIISAHTFIAVEGFSTLSCWPMKFFRWKYTDNETNQVFTPRRMQYAIWNCNMKLQYESAIWCNMMFPNQYVGRNAACAIRTVGNDRMARSIMSAKMRVIKYLCIIFRP